ncbi:aromatic ring-hydroxylating dioxygenase subunit alpha [Acetobacter conturbans]|uniref:Rieske 2Fe-2S domain-containing protein n=1 Tax=Acetobacter conturbans TaxID=1737472 RepID=A0ABX0K6P6_9PROT|nr:aromatic ring-hydroxylating dioxygenase subunit alpha [Acetobacter conturbans]NHN90048.1 Rieske 2Fe-2S domain-containing protein [Acetobacter conturbans]
MTERSLPSISDLIRQRQERHTPPAGFYNREDLFNVDINVFFHNQWIFVGIECDIPESGDVYAVDIGDTGILLVRDDSGKPQAYYNTCRHRGARLVPAGKSIVGKLVCPYHQWTYELDGALVEAPHMGGDLNRECFSLRSVALRSVSGLLYVCLAEKPPEDVVDLIEIMEPRLLPYELGETKIAFEMEIVEEGNWKLVIENNRECYHCAVTHPELCSSFIDLDFGFDPEFLLADDRHRASEHEARYADQTALWEREGLPSAAVEHLVGHATNFRTQRLMMAGTGESQTMDTRAACRLPLGRMSLTGVGDIHLWGHNCWHHFMRDHAICSTVLPLARDKTLVRTKWLVHKDAVEGVDYDLANLISVWKATNEQDAALVKLAQEGINNRGYQSGPYSRFTEKQLDHFMIWYVDRLTAYGY